MKVAIFAQGWYSKIEIILDLVLMEKVI